MTDKQKRDAVRNAYLSPNWAEKVDAMPDKQIAAIWKRLKAQNVIK